MHVAIVVEITFTPTNGVCYLPVECNLVEVTCVNDAVKVRVAKENCI